MTGHARTLASFALFGALLSCGVPATPSVAVRPSPRPELELIVPADPAKPLRMRFAYPNAATVLGEGGVQLWASPRADEVWVHAIIDAPASRARWSRCDRATLFVDGERLDLRAEYIGRPMARGIYDAVRVDVGVHHLRRLAAAERVVGTVCGDPIAITAPQRRTIGRFVSHFDRMAAPRSTEGAPGYREVGPRMERLPNEPAVPGPYAA